MSPVSPMPPVLQAPKTPRAWELPILIVDKRDLEGISAGEQWASRGALTPINDYKFALRLAEQYSKDTNGQAHAVLQAKRGAEFFVTPLSHTVGGGRLVASGERTNLEPYVAKGIFGIGKKTYDFVSVERITDTLKAVASDHHVVEFAGGDLGPISVDPPVKPDALTSPPVTAATPAA